LIKRSTGFVCIIAACSGVGKQRCDNPGCRVGDDRPDGDLLLAGPVDALDAQCGIQVFLDRVGCRGQEARGVGQLGDEGGVVVAGGLVVDGIQLGVQGGGRVVEFGVVLADACPVGGGGRAGVAAELGEFGDEAFLCGVVAG
jgi:hypothetical protein